MRYFSPMTPSPTPMYSFARGEGVKGTTLDEPFSTRKIMKTFRLTHLVSAAFGLAAFSATGCTGKDRIAEAPLTPATAVKPTATIAVPESTNPVQVATTASSDVGFRPWVDIENLTYDKRSEFFAGLKRLEARVDVQIGELKAIRAAMKNTDTTQDWDFAMKEMGDAGSYLKSMGEEAGKATRQTWDQQKDKVGQAWKRTQAAYEKVKASTTG